MAEEPTADGPVSFEQLLAEHAQEFGGEVDPVEVEQADDAVEDVDVRGEDGESMDAGDEDAQEEVDEKPWKPGSGKRPGTDVIKKYLEENYPEAADVVARMESTVSRNVNETKELQGDLIEALREVEQLRDQLRSGGSPKGKSGEKQEQQKERIYTDDQLDLVREILRDEGVVLKSELTAKEEADKQTSYVAQALKQGVEEYGEAFGSIDDEGNVTITDEVREQLGPILERLETQGVTPLDLVKIAGLTPKQRAEAGDDTEEAPKQKRQARNAETLRKSRVVKRTGGAAARATPQLFDKSKGDTSDTVFEKSWALARAELSQL